MFWDVNASGMAAVVAAVCLCYPAGASGEWHLASSPHFEIYSQAGPGRAKFTLQRLEELRLFFDQNRIANTAPGPQNPVPVRVLEFGSAKQWEAVQLRPAADAYFSALGDRSYIVKPVFAANDFSTVAHEYAHYVLRSGGLKLPLWLNEGIAELMSTVTIAARRCELGGPLPVRLDTLRRHAWIPASELLGVEQEGILTRDTAAVFYAQSWAITDMLESSPLYAPGFGGLIEMLNTGVASARAIQNVYGKQPETVVNDARQWVGRGASRRRTLSPLPAGTSPVHVERIPEARAQAVIADLLLTNGEWDRAGNLYRDLLRQAPNDPDLLASLGTVALRKDDPHTAISYWRKALDAGLKDSALCYRYAQLADRIDLPPEQVAQALEQTIALRPDFDDARFRLAQLRSNQGDYQGATAQLQAMKHVLPGRAFGYWTALAYALSELGERDRAQAAAARAKSVAADAAERARAEELAYVARTDFGVQFIRNSEGNLQLVTTRVPHGAAAANPFIEAQDHILVASGRLREVQCSDGKLIGFVVERTDGKITLTVPDPARVQIRKGPSEFVCGVQTAVNVTVEYAITAQPDHGVLRGLEY